MGEIADMMIDGILDSETGEFIDDEWSRQGGPGFPRTMNGRNNTMYKYSHAVNGVKKFLKIHTELDPAEMHGFCVGYLEQERDIVYDDSVPTPSWEEVAGIIQQDFDSFVKYVKPKH